MKKKFFIVALLISVSLNGFSKELFDSESAAIEAVKSEVINQVNEKLLSRMQQELKSEKGKGIKPDFGEIGKSMQFLCQESKIAELYKNGKENKNALQLKEIFNKLKDKAIRPSDFTFTNLKVGQAETEDLGNEVSYTFSISFEAQTQTPTIGNKAKYVVAFNYKGSLKKKKENPTVNGKKDKKAEKIVVGYEINKKAEFENSSVSVKSIFDSESAYMKQKVAERIAAWYNDIPSNLDAKYSKYITGNKGIKPVNVNGIEIKQNGKNFTATGKSVEIDYVPEIDESSLYLYTDPIATISITPSFNIEFGDDLATIVSQNVVTKDNIKEATTDSEKVQHYETARKALNDFSNSLSEYVADNKKEGREKIMIMFTDAKNDEVAVSHRSKFNNKENINQRKADQYLKLLSGKNLTFESIDYIDSSKASLLNVEYPELNLSYDPNLYTIMFDVIQIYDGNNYKDKTRKIIVMKNQDDNTYQIDKILVVPNSTIID